MINKLFSRANLKSIATATILSLSSSIIACQNETKQTIQQITPIQPQAKPKPAPPKFSPHTYSPPTQADIVETNIEPDNQKTVIYIADYHKTSYDDELGKKVQKEIYAVVNDLVKTYQHLDIAAETWAIGNNFEDFTDKLRNDHPFRRYHQNQNSKQVTERLIDRTSAPISPIIFGHFQTQVNPIGTVSKQDTESIDAFAKDLKRYSKLKQQQIEYCQDETPTECYCAAQEFEQQVNTKLDKRLEDIPKQEVRQALTTTKDFVVLIAGISHLQNGLPEIKQNNANFIVVSPKSITYRIDSIRNQDMTKQNFPDTAEHNCSDLDYQAQKTVQVLVTRINAAKL